MRERTIGQKVRAAAARLRMLLGGEAELLRAEVERLQAELVEARRDAHQARIDYQLARRRADSAEREARAMRAVFERADGGAELAVAAMYFDDAVLRCAACRGRVSDVGGRTWAEVNAARVAHTCLDG
ncbi:hypothetical protein [uncultured Thermomonospora sp.]|uniref:hypothetical protein n=1 Tax=uncultured Thermomonospora sp. TaxID=671175 RepID=UPI00259BB57E|nr:hypothetical protein [uncultured Thermomonospora sp.]